MGTPGSLAVSFGGVTVNSVGIRTALHRYAGIAKRKIQVIANLIDESTFRASSTEERRKARQELGLSQDAFVWVLPARMSWVKNQIGLVFALAILKRRGALGPDVEVVLAGRQRDLLASKLVPMLARVLGVRSHLRIFPAFTDPSVLYRASDALVLPSWAEGMPNVVLESLLSAVPAVVTHQANRDDLVRHGDSGFTVRTGSAVALADAMSRLMQLPPEARHRLGESGRQALIQRFARDPIVATLSSLYETAIAANLLQRDKVTSVVFSKPAPATIPPDGPLQDSALNEISV
jgi:glycosyltransferase involved in cell wall biosynthesis